MSKISKPMPAAFSFSKKWIIWSVVMLALAIFTAKDQIGLDQQLNQFTSVLVIFVIAPYLIVNLRRFKKIRRRKKEDAIPGFDEIDKSLLSPFSVTMMISRLGYSLLILFTASLVSIFFQEIDLVAILGSLFLAVINAGMLYSRKYVFAGSKFWRRYVFSVLVVIILIDFALVYWGNLATAIVFPLIFIYSLLIIIGIIKNRPTTTGESPHKWLALILTFAPLVAIALTFL